MIKHQQASDEQTVGNDEEMGTNDEKEVVDVMAEDEQPSESADSGNHYSNDNDDRATSVEQTAAEMGDSAHTEFSDATTQSEEAADKVVAPTQSSSTARADRWAADQKQQNLNEQATQLNEYDVNPAQTCELLSVQNLVDEKPAAHQAQQTGDAESSKFEDIEPKCAEQSAKESKDDVDEDPAQPGGIKTNKASPGVPSFMTRSCLSPVPPTLTQTRSQTSHIAQLHTGNIITGISRQTPGPES